MADKEQIKEQVLSFLKKAGEDIKRVGADVKTETERLMEQLRNPETQASARAKLDELGTWAKKTAEDAAGLAETAMLKVEESLSTATDFVSEKVVGAKQRGGGAAAKAPSVPREPKAGPRKPARKTVGRKSSGGGKKTSGNRPSTKKTLGRKKG